MSERVYMVHPDLPDQPIWVRPGAVAAHRASRWQPADEPQPEPEPEAPPRRRRATKHEGDEQ